MKMRIAVLSLLSAGAIASVKPQHATFRGRWFLEAPSYALAFTQCGDHDKWLVVVDSNLLANSQHEHVDTAMVYIADTKDTADLDSITASLLPLPIFVVVQGDTSPR